MPPGDKEYWEKKSKESEERARWQEKEYWPDSRSKQDREDAREQRENAERRKIEEEN